MKKLFSVLSIATLGLLSACNVNGSVLSVFSSTSDTSSTSSVVTTAPDTTSSVPSSASSITSQPSDTSYVSSASDSSSATKKDLADKVIAAYNNGDIKLPDTEDYGISGTAQASMKCVNDDTDSYNSIDVSGSLASSLTKDSASGSRSAGLTLSQTSTIDTGYTSDATPTSSMTDVIKDNIEASDKLYAYFSSSIAQGSDTPEISEEMFYADHSFDYFFGLLGVSAIGGTEIPALDIPQDSLDSIAAAMFSPNSGMALAPFDYTAVESNGEIDFEIKSSSIFGQLLNMYTSTTNFADTFNSFIDESADIPYLSLIAGMLGDVHFNSVYLVFPAAASIDLKIGLDADSYLPLSIKPEFNFDGLTAKINMTAASDQFSSADPEPVDLSISIPKLSLSAGLDVTYGADVSPVTMSDDMKTKVLASGTDVTAAIDSYLESLSGTGSSY